MGWSSNDIVIGDWIGDMFRIPILLSWFIAPRWKLLFSTIRYLFKIIFAFYKARFRHMKFGPLSYIFPSGTK